MVYALQLPKCDLMRKKDSKLFSLASCFSLHKYQNVSVTHCLKVSEKGLRERSPIDVIQIADSKAKQLAKDLNDAVSTPGRGQGAARV